MPAVMLPSSVSRWNISNILGTCEPSRLFPHEFLCVVWSSSLHAPATSRTNNAVHSRVAGEGLNLGHAPARGILATFLDEMLLHLHLQLVSLHTSFDLWLNSPCSHRADFFKDSHMYSTKKRIRRLAEFLREALAALGFLHSSKFHSVRLQG